MDEAAYEALRTGICSEPGGLVEIYIAGTSLEDWRSVVTVFSELSSSMLLTDAVTSSGTTFGPHLFEASDEVAYAMSATIGAQVWTTTFAQEDRIDIQGDPRQMQSREEVKQVVELMRHLLHATGKQVMLVPETLSYESVRPFLTMVN